MNENENHNQSQPTPNPSQNPNPTKITKKTSRAKRARREKSWLKPSAKNWEGKFLKYFAECGIAGQACMKAHVWPSTVNRKREADPTFAKAYLDAHDIALSHWEKEAARRAFEGNERPVYQQGREVGSIREYSDLLTMFMIKGAHPEKYRENTPRIQINTSDNKSVTQNTVVLQFEKKEVDAIGSILESLGVPTVDAVDVAEQQSTVVAALPEPKKE